MTVADGMYDDKDVDRNQGDELRNTLGGLLYGKPSKQKFTEVYVPGVSKTTYARTDCEDCNGTGWYGDNGPGIAGNAEYDVCECVDKRNVLRLTEDAMAYYMNHSVKLERLLVGMTQWMRNALSVSYTLSAMLSQTAFCKNCNCCTTIVTKEKIHHVCTNPNSPRYTEEISESDTGCAAWARNVDDEELMNRIVGEVKKQEQSYDQEMFARAAKLAKRLNQPVPTGANSPIPPLPPTFSGGTTK